MFFLGFAGLKDDVVGAQVAYPILAADMIPRHCEKNSQMIFCINFH